MGDEAGRMTAEPCAGCGCKWKRCRPDTTGSDTGDVVCAYCGTFQSRYEFTDLPAAPVGSDDEGKTDLPDAETAWKAWLDPAKRRIAKDQLGFLCEVFKAGFAAASGPWAEQLDAANAEITKLKDDQAIADRLLAEFIRDRNTAQADRDAALARNAELQAEVDEWKSESDDQRKAFVWANGACQEQATQKWAAIAERDAARAELDNLRDVPAECDNGQGNTCRHDSASGMDASFGPGKVWRCDHCGLCWIEGYSPHDPRAAIVRGSDDAEGDA